jgi:proprotein convertase subtilisin/kexin type 5
LVWIIKNFIKNKNKFFISKKCHISCLTCDKNGCSSCTANRIKDQFYCTCPAGGVDRTSINNPFCTTCELGVLEIRFSDDLSMIKIQFGKKFTVPESFYLD